MKLPIVCVFVVLLLVIPAYALFESTSLDQYIVRYNSSVDKAPTVIKSLIGSERVELDITMNNGTQFKVGMETNNGLVVRTMNGGIENPTIQIQTREEVMQTMSQATDPITAFQQAKEAGNISVTGNNGFSNLKVNAALSNMDILKFFSGVLSGQELSNRGIQPGSSPDNTSPEVQAFQVTPISLTTGESLTINYTVADKGGSGLKQVELWRKDEQNEWHEIKPQNILAAEDGPFSGSFTDSPSGPDKYSYGIHVVDNAGNWNDEKNSNTNNRPGSYGPIEVEIEGDQVTGQAPK